MPPARNRLGPGPSYSSGASTQWTLAVMAECSARQEKTEDDFFGIRGIMQLLGRLGRPEVDERDCRLSTLPFLVPCFASPCLAAPKNVRTCCRTVTASTNPCWVRVGPVRTCLPWPT